MFKLLFIALLMTLSGCFEKCETLVVLSKDKCTFDREHMARVCVVRLGENEQVNAKGARGRVSATYMPEPLTVGETQVEVCTRLGRKYFEKL